ncbi:MAG TPA: helix-turn-helix domain-containing protein [Candidatus Eisenbacteria bacterium]|nr:helix-turn-helix domain-containing protein [Candidatus Eisenbacteria bacterium]
MAVAARRNETAEAILDAAERLLIEVGHANVTTRGLAAEARVNQGLVHYYFGAIEQVFLEVLDRFTERLIVRQRAMYQADAPFLEKWRTAWRFQEEDLASGYDRIFLELQAMAWTRPELRARVAHVNAEWRGVLREAFGRALREYGLDERTWPLEAVTALVMTMAQGFQLERMSGITEGHDALLTWIDGWLAAREPRRAHNASHRQHAGRRADRALSRRRRT